MILIWSVRQLIWFDYDLIWFQKKWSDLILIWFQKKVIWFDSDLIGTLITHCVSYATLHQKYDKNFHRFFVEDCAMPLCTLRLFIVFLRQDTLYFSCVVIGNLSSLLDVATLLRRLECVRSHLNLLGASIWVVCWVLLIFSVAAYCMKWMKEEGRPATTSWGPVRFSTHAVIEGNVVN